MTASGS